MSFPALDDGLTLTLPADVRWLCVVRRVIEASAQLAGFPERGVYEIVLAVHEACANVIEHGYERAAGKSLCLACRANEQGLEIRVRDQGQPFDIVAAPHLPPDELREGGRGVFLIRRLMDEVESQRSPDGVNELRMLRRYAT
jgi:anti-sigma regulatory factor (Ser/Thr protein kinase)